MKDGLTPKQQRFVDEYLIDLNATQAAIRAGYSKDTANEQGSQNLAKLSIQSAIAERQTKLAEKLEITQERVLAEYAKLGFANMLDYVTVQEDGSAYVDLSALTREQAAAIQEMTVDEYTEGKGEDARGVKKVKIKLSDKRGALDSIGKHLGMFIERNVNIDVTNLTPEERQRRIDELIAKRGS
jgi:phage terminase small subunit